jgi:hypothetical protein
VILVTALAKITCLEATTKHTKITKKDKRLVRSTWLRVPPSAAARSARRPVERFFVFFVIFVART